MPTSLPPGPSLDHLRKQAKTLLRAFRRNDSAAIERFSVLRLRGVPRLADAQHVIALEYGFDNWPALKRHVESLEAPDDHLLREAKAVFQRDDAVAFRRLLERHPKLKARINDPVADFASPLINHVRSRAMLDVLLDAGADVNAKSRWWAGGFGLLDRADPDVAAHAIRRGASITVHAAARLADLESLRLLIDADPELVHSRGGDGQTPLHFAATIDVAEFLLDRGAEIDARDVDHESTPAQYMVRKRPEVARYLVERGCRTDILMAAALGDADLVRAHLEADPESVRMRVSDEYFPMVDSGKGGTIYQWELGWYVSAYQVARSFNYPEVFDLIMERSPAEEKLLNACWTHDESVIHALLAEEPALSKRLPAAGRRHAAHAARNNDTNAARLMLDAGLPAAGTFSQHHGTALHWASFHGNVELVRLILPYFPSLEDTDNEFSSTPLGWAIHGSENGWERDTGDYAETVRALLEAGATPPPRIAGSRAVKALLRRSRI